jgi:prepilin-type N-terminal cleavage/methylation domain-containing protein
VQPGFSLVELLVVLVAASGLLAAAWGWFWTVNARVDRGTEGAEASTSLAFARRLMLRELRGAASLAAPATGPGCGERSLALVPGAEVPTGLVQYAWDSARQVLWRATSSGHVADGVTDFCVTYYDDEGRPVEPASGGALGAAQVSVVRSVRMRVALGSGRSTIVGEWTIALRNAP